MSSNLLCVEMLIGTLALITLVAGGAFALPFLIHDRSVRSWSDPAKAPVWPGPSGDPVTMTILLPVFEEGRIIEWKLDDLANNLDDLECHLFLIDSASNDDTVVKVKDWLETNGSVFTGGHTLHVMDERRGKTAAVQIAVEMIGDSTDIIAMTDADASLGKGSLVRLNHWFRDPLIGAVGATPDRQSSSDAEGVSVTLEAEHRRMFSRIRLGESAWDSTPFLEGSLMGWRTSHLQPEDLRVSSNADDAQIATAVRLAGLKAIQDPELIFFDPIPPTRSTQRRQKVRRAQGLQRLLHHHRRRWFDRRLGTYSKILRRQAWFHLGAPMMYLLYMAGTITVLGVIAIESMESSFHLPWSILPLTIAGVAWAALALTPISPLRSIHQGMIHLLRSMWTTIRGRSLHMWEPISEVRAEIASRDENAHHWDS